MAEWLAVTEEIRLTMTSYVSGVERQPATSLYLIIMVVSYLLAGYKAVRSYVAS